MSRGLVVTCSGRTSDPHGMRYVFGSYSAKARAWLYVCPSCRYDVAVPEGHRPGLEQQFAELDLHHLAQLMTARKLAAKAREGQA